MGSCFGTVSHMLWLHSLKYNSTIFEYMIAREMENPTTARLWRLLLACSITPQIRHPQTLTSSHPHILNQTFSNNSSHPRAQILRQCFSFPHQESDWHAEVIEDLLLRAEDHDLTSIVALIRGGEAMALGVNEAFPCAMSVHAKGPELLYVCDFALASEGISSSSVWIA